MPISIRRAIIICALGYFMDVFDYNLFTVLRVSSLKDIGVPVEAQANIAGYIIDAQLVGILLGAFLWGYLGDRYGRLKALYGSIFIYSIATLGCSLLHDPVTYGVLRFFAGFGIAGEIGAATTLIAELMPARQRGWGVVAIAGVGTSAPAVAVLISWFADWRTTYVIAGSMGLILLILRMRLVEPELFQKISVTANQRGSLKLLMRPKQSVILISCILLAAVGTYGNWFLNFFSLELSRPVLAAGEVFDQKTSLFTFYVGLGLGGFLVCILSQIWRSRRKAVAGCLSLGGVMTILYLILGPYIKLSAVTIYTIYFVLGIAGGLWSLVIMIAAEHFGTNIRATTSTLVGNLARATTIPVLLLFQSLKGFIGIPGAAALIGFVIYMLAFWGLSRLRETHALDLDYIEI